MPFVISKNVKKIGFAVLAFAFLVVGCGAEVTSDGRFVRSTDPIQMEGVPNFHKISEDLYRSGKPTAEGMKNFREHWN